MNRVGRTPWSAADALVGLGGRPQEAGQGAGCRPGGPPHPGSQQRDGCSRALRSHTLVQYSQDKPLWPRGYSCLRYCPWF